LLARLAARVEQQIGTQRVRDMFETHALTRFPNDPVQPQRVLDDGHGRLIVYPTLEDRGDSVSLVMARTEREQRRLSRDGYARMVLLAEHKTARMLTKRLKGEHTLGLHYAPLGNADALYDSLLRASVWHTFFADVALPQSTAEFDARIAERGSSWI